MTEEWGPIIENDGKGCPVPVGTYVRIESEWPDGKRWVDSGWVTEYVWLHPMWEECFFGAHFSCSASGTFKVVGRVLWYQVRRPKGLQKLDTLLEELQELEPV